MSKLSLRDHKLGIKQICVALIDDHDLTRVGIRTALQRSGKARIVGEATNAIDGLKLLKQTCPDVAIIDIGLPGMSGIELTRKFRQLRQANREPETKVMMLTLQDDEAAVLSAFVAGADSYCMKDSVNSHTLLKVLQDTYEGRNWIDPQVASIVLKQSCSRQFQPEQASKITTVTINKISLDQKQLLEAEPLTSRQLEILELVVAGYSNKEIAKQLHITLGTAKTHVRDILRKLCADDRTQAAVRALRAGLIS